MERKGIILAGGLATRLYPITLTISKHLLPVFDKPMIYYPLSTLMLAGIRQILIISTPKDTLMFEELLGDGSTLGINISYAYQLAPKGIAEAFLIGEKFLKNSPSALILGDNIFYGNSFDLLLKKANNNKRGATIFVYHVNEPQRYGVIELNKNEKIVSIEEKPKKPKSNLVVTGLYFYDKNVVEYVRSLKPSMRGELEITDLNSIYLSKNSLSMVRVGRGYAWLDTGTPESLQEANQFVQTIEHRQGLKISCPEEIAFRKKWISSEQLEKIAKPMLNNSYGKYLKGLLKELN